MRLLRQLLLGPAEEGARCFAKFWIHFRHSIFLTGSDSDGSLRAPVPKGTLNNTAPCLLGGETLILFYTHKTVNAFSFLCAIKSLILAIVKF